MKLVTNRIDQISQYLQPYMQECFRESCVRLQEEIDSHACELWEELARAMEECLNSAVSLQNQGRKGRLVYLVFSVLGHGAYLNGPEIWIDTLDDGFYLDRQEAKGHYHPRFLQERYTGDLDCLYKKACEKFIRLQDYEWDGIKKEYMGFYCSILFRMLGSLAGPLMGTVADSRIPTADDFRIIFGEYMGKGTVIYEGGRP